MIEVPQAQLIDEAAEVLEIMQRHDPMIQKFEGDQKTWINKAEAQLSRVRSSADTGSSERKKKLYREAHKSDTQDTASRSQT